MHDPSVTDLRGDCPAAGIARQRDGSSTRVVGAFDRETVFDPVFLAAEVHPHVAVSQDLETRSCDLRTLARAAAVHDDGCIVVGNQSWSEHVDLIGWHVERPGQVGIGEVGSAERLEQRHRFTGGHDLMEFLA